MVSHSNFTRLGKSYLWLVIVVGLAITGWSIYSLYVEPVDQQWFILAALTLISGSATVTLPFSYASISISETFVFTAVLLYGPEAGTVIVALDALVLSFWISKRHDEPHRALFNMSAPAISAWCSAHLFFYVAGIAPLVVAPAPVNAILPALAVFAFTYFALNSWLVAFVIALERRLNPVTVWTSSFIWLSLNYFGGASVAILFVGYNRTISLGYFGVILPLLLVLYFTFKTTMGRVEDANKHVQQVDRLYLSTVETLAMAIDAKDQVTHGHLRRVHTYATSLARELGVRDEALIKAIEAAALLHDMGKLAVPEYILNKPGKLTDVEFERMKLHAGVGADILSAISFPYPVVPIVRHHHENWDGTGYPSGIRGTDIPIGARILAVVDCFDALTSDRPYRTRLSDQDALRILADRRGSVYDPLVVDTFFRIHGSIPRETAENGSARGGLGEITGSRPLLLPSTNSPRQAEVATSDHEVQLLSGLARAVPTQADLGCTGDSIAQYLRQHIPWSLCVFYLCDPASTELDARHAVGDDASLVRGTRIPLGKGLSGWVAANRQTISNSDPALDLGGTAQVRALPLRSCLATPLACEGHLVGVISLYCGDANAFSETHVRIIEVLSQPVATAVRDALEIDSGLGATPSSVLLA